MASSLFGIFLLILRMFFKISYWVTFIALRAGFGGFTKPEGGGGGVSGFIQAIAKALARFDVFTPRRKISKESLGAFGRVSIMTGFQSKLREPGCTWQIVSSAWFLKLPYWPVNFTHTQKVKIFTLMLFTHENS